MERSDWYRIAALVDRFWPHGGVDRTVADAWWPLVADLDADAVTEAVTALRAEPGREFPPGPGDIRAQVDGSPDAHAAVAQVAAALQRGETSVDALSDPHARSAVRRLGGMKQLGRREDRWWRKEFVDAWRGIRGTAVADAAVASARQISGGGLTALLSGDDDG